MGDIMSNLEDTAARKLMAQLDACVELEDVLDRTRMEADTDDLTGLLNRRGLERRTRARNWGWYVAADLDGFKRAQDNHPEGHSHGDRILKAFAEWLEQNVRHGDIIPARIHGDEFLLWVETRAGARRIKDAIRAWCYENVTSSAGLGRTPEAADAALYLAKRGPLEGTEP